MNTELIIKNMSNCSRDKCDECLYENTGPRCVENLLKDVLTIIKEKDAYIETLKKENKYLRERLAEETKLKVDMTKKH